MGRQRDRICHRPSTPCSGRVSSSKTSLSLALTARSRRSYGDRARGSGRRRLRVRIPGRSARAAATPSRRTSLGFSSSSMQGVRPCFGRGLGDQATGLAVGDQVGVAADPRNHAGQGGRHALRAASCSSLRRRWARQKCRPHGGNRRDCQRHRQTERDRRFPAIPPARSAAGDRCRARPGSSWRWPTADDFGPGFEQERQVFLRMETAGEDHARAGEQIGLDRAGARVEVLRHRRRWPCG